MDDAALWEAFWARTLSAAEWTHEAHLRMAWLARARWGLDEAHLRLRVGIIRLNHAHGLEETPTRGYHETITRTWLAIVGALRRARPCDDSLTFVRACASELGRDALLGYYRRETLGALDARTRWVPPELRPLPDS